MQLSLPRGGLTHYVGRPAVPWKDFPTPGPPPPGARAPPVPFRFVDPNVNMASATNLVNLDDQLADPRWHQMLAHPPGRRGGLVYPPDLPNEPVPHASTVRPRAPPAAADPPPVQPVPQAPAPPVLRHSASVPAVHPSPVNHGVPGTRLTQHSAPILPIQSQTGLPIKQPPVTGPRAPREGPHPPAGEPPAHVQRGRDSSDSAGGPPPSAPPAP